MKNIILIAGDSWGCGELIFQGEGEISHGGLTQYLTEYGHNVRNLAYPSGSNLDACKRLTHYLNYNPHEACRVSAILFWQTEFFREIWHFKRSDREIALKNGYSTLKSQWIAMPYYRLSEISTKFNIPVYVIGGCSDAYLYDDFENDFPGVKVTCQSLVNYLVHDNDRIVTPVYTEFLNGWIDEFLELISPYNNNADLKELTADIELGTARIAELDKAPDLFFPDGIHPNRFAQYKTFKFLLEKIPELKL